MQQLAAETLCFPVVRPAVRPSRRSLSTGRPSDELSFMWHKNVDRSFFRFVTIYAFDRQTDGRTEICLRSTMRYITCSYTVKIYAVSFHFMYSAIEMSQTI